MLNTLFRAKRQPGIEHNPSRSSGVLDTPLGVKKRAEDNCSCSRSVLETPLGAYRGTSLIRKRTPPRTTIGP